MVAAQPIAARVRGRTSLAAAWGAAHRPRAKSQATLAVESSGGRARLDEWWRRGKMSLGVRDGRDAARSARSDETRARRGASRSWEDVVARRALIVARHRPETIGRTFRTHGACGTVADRAWWPRRRCAVDAGASAGLNEASHVGEGRGWSRALETQRRGLERLDWRRGGPRMHRIQTELVIRVCV